MATGQIFDLKITGEEAMIRNFERIAKNLEDMAPKAIEDAVQPTMAMMKRLVRVDTGKLQASIRFRIGNQGLAKTGQRTAGGPLGKTRVVGYIIAGDQTTLVKGSGMSTREKGGKKRSRSHLTTGTHAHLAGGMWQNAILQEFGTTSMQAKPFFFPSWRATKQKVKHEIGVALSAAFRKLNKPTKAAA